MSKLNSLIMRKNVDSAGFKELKWSKLGLCSF